MAPKYTPSKKRLCSFFSLKNIALIAKSRFSGARGIQSSKTDDACAQPYSAWAFFEFLSLGEGAPPIDLEKY